MPRKQVIITYDPLTDGADSVLKVTLQSAKNLRGKTVYSYTRNLEDINTDFGEIDETKCSISSVSGEICKNKIRKVKNAPVIPEEILQSQPLTPEQLDELSKMNATIVIEGNEDTVDSSIDDLLTGLGAINIKGGKKGRVSKSKKSKKYRNKKRQHTNKKRRRL
jgi:hypothetical protein